MVFIVNCKYRVLSKTITITSKSIPWVDVKQLLRTFQYFWCMCLNNKIEITVHMLSILHSTSYF